MLFLLFMVNVVISFFNAYSVGGVWDSARVKGGWARIMAWAAAVMSASGFTWCYMVILGLLGSVIPMDFQDPSQGMLLAGESLQAFYEIGYMIIVFPILGSGLAITVDSWRSLARKDRSVGDFAITGWNTYAQVSNIQNAYENLPGITDHLSDFFKDSDDKKSAIVIFLVAIALLGGIMSTYAIIQYRRRTARMDEMLAAD